MVLEWRIGYMCFLENFSGLIKKETVTKGQ